MSKQSRLLSVALMLLFALSFTPLFAGTASAQEEECVIPESGPWPPCATGGETAPPAEEAEMADEAADLEVGEPRVVLEIDGPDGKETVGVPPLLVPFDGLLVSGIAHVASDLAVEGRGYLSGLQNGSTNECDAFEENYLSLVAAPIFVGASGSAANIVAVYETGIQKIADGASDFFLYCYNGGAFSSLSHYLAVSGYEEGVSILERAANEAAEAFGTPDAPVTPPSAPEAEAPAEPTPEEPADPEDPAVPEEPAPADPAPTDPAPADPAPAATDNGGRPDDVDAFPGSHLYFGDQYPLGAARVTLFLDSGGGTEEVTFLPNVVPFTGDDFTTVAFWSTAFVDLVRTDILPGMSSSSGASNTECSLLFGAFIILSVSPRFSGVPAAYQPWIDQYNNGVQQFLNGAKDLVQWCINGGAFSSTAHTLAVNGTQNAYNVLFPVTEAALGEFGVPPAIEEAFGFAPLNRGALALNAMSSLRFNQMLQLSTSNVH